MKKVVFVNLWRVLNAYGGTERVFFNMANALAERDYSVTLISCDNGKGGGGFLGGSEG